MVQKIPCNELQPLLNSLVDPIGRLFFWKGRALRGIYPSAVQHVRELLDSKLIRELSHAGLMPATTIIPLEMEAFPLVLEHELVQFANFPFEWSFAMLKDAALLTLEVQRRAAKHGYELVDAHPQNVMFNGVTPWFLDLGSFRKAVGVKGSWKAYGEFLSAFLYPLEMWSQGDEFLARSLLYYSRNVPHASYYRWNHSWLKHLPFTLLGKALNYIHTFFCLSTLSGNWLGNRFPGNLGKALDRVKKWPLIPLQRVDIPRLIAKVDALRMPGSSGYWAEYHLEYKDSSGRIMASPRMRRTVQILSRFPIKDVIEIAGNQGVVSRLMAQETGIERIICSDIDSYAIDRLYEELRKDPGDPLRIQPMVLDLVSPIIQNGNPPWQRLQADAVLAMAVTHHLLISPVIRYPVDFVLECLGSYAKKFVFVEFMPEGFADGKDRPRVPEWYTLGWFREAFAKKFEILLQEQTEFNRILFVGEIKSEIKIKI